MTNYDVYSYGMVSSSILHILADKFPEPDAYAEIEDTYRMVGGEAANSSIVLSRLGVHVKLDGNWLGNNDNGNHTLQFLKNYNIDTERLTVKEHYRGVEENVFTDGKTRTNFGTYRKLLSTEKQWNDPSEEDIKNAKLICLDPFFKQSSAKAAELCGKHNKLYVTIDCKFTDEIAKNAAVNIISGEFRNNEYRGQDVKELFLQYTENAKGLVIFTFGAGDIFYARKGEGIKKYTPYKINPVDTTGGGDSFRAGIIYGLLKKWPEEKMLNFACGLAAFICVSFPGVLNCPDYNEVVNYIESNGRKL